MKLHKYIVANDNLVMKIYFKLSCSKTCLIISKSVCLYLSTDMSRIKYHNFTKKKLKYSKTSGSRG